MLARYTPVAAALLTYLILGSFLCIKTPLWFSPDEELHVAYSQYIARNRTLPKPDIIARQQPVVMAFHPPRYISARQQPVVMAFHPPLYYAAGSLFFNADDELVENSVHINNGPGYALLNDGAESSTLARKVYLLRFFTLLCGIPIILAAYAAGCILFPQTVVPASIAAFFIAVNPQLLHIASGVANEIPTASLCALVLIMLLTYCRRELSAKALLLTGCLLGAGLLTKTSAVFLVPLSVLVITFARRQSLFRILRDIVIVIGSAVLVSGWWYLLNWKMLSSLQTSQPWFNRRTPLSVDYLIDIGTNTFISFFGFFGSQQIALSPAYLIFYGLVIAAGICGLLKMVLGLQQNRQAVALALVLIIALAGGASIFALLNYTYYAPQGKYLYTVIVPIALLIGAGYCALFPARLKTAAAVMLIILLILSCLMVLQNVFMPSIQVPRLKCIVSQPDFNCRTPYITPMQPLTHSFQAPEDGLCGIRLLFSKSCSSSSGVLNIRVIQHTPSEVEVCSIDLPVKDINDSHWYYFSFTPQQESATNSFSLDIQGRDIDPHARLALWCASQDSAEQQKKAPVPDRGCTPCFEAYAFTGTVPESAWEGLEMLAIRQNLYVSVREMQLFTQCLPGSANRTAISRKWKRLEHAAINRQAGCAMEN